MKTLKGKMINNNTNFHLKQKETFGTALLHYPQFLLYVMRYKHIKKKNFKNLYGQRPFLGTFL